MAFAFAHSNHMPCGECGASVATADRAGHVCDPARVLDFRLFQLRPEIESFEEGLRAYLETPQGRFALWLAERNRPRRP